MTARDAKHMPCNCVPDLGPPHCHQHPYETEWPCAESIKAEQAEHLRRFYA